MWTSFLMQEQLKFEYSTISFVALGAICLPLSKLRRANVIEGDIRDTALVDRACEGIDYVFHEAALRITQCADVPREAVEVLIGGMVNVLESAVRHGSKKGCGCFVCIRLW